MNIREMLLRDFGIKVLISGGNGVRDDAYVLEACSAEEAALTQWSFLRGLGFGRNTHWKFSEWRRCDTGSATEVVRIEEIHFGQTEVNSSRIAFYFDTRAVNGSPCTSHPLVAWRGPSGTPVLPRDLGWLHFDQTVTNANSPNDFDQTIQYSAPGAKAGVSVYTSSRTEDVDARIDELKLTLAVMQRTLPDLQEPWPAFEAGPFIVKPLRTAGNVTMAGVAVSGPYFIKVRLTFAEDPEMIEMMNETLRELATHTHRASSPSH